jgi:hypothetical protein
VDAVFAMKMGLVRKKVSHGLGYKAIPLKGILGYEKA